MNEWKQIQASRYAFIVLSIVLVALGTYFFMRGLQKNLTSTAGTYQTIDPKVAQFSQALAMQDGPPIYTLQPEQARKILDDLQAPTVNVLPADVEDKEIAIDQNKKISVRIVRPLNNKNKLPSVVFAHGGGWVLGNKDTHDLLVRRIATGANVGIIFVNYTLSPEAHYPVAIEQIYDVANYVAQHGDEFNVDGTKLAIVGDSVGGLMATEVALRAKQRGTPHISYQVLMYPVTDASFDTASYHQFAQGPWLTKKAMQWFWDNYAPDKNERTQSMASPLRATLDELKGLPPALIITDENDVLRDEGEAYAHKLMQAGVEVAALRILGTVHDFAILAPLKDTQPTLLAIEIVTMKLLQMLHQK